MLGFCGLGHLFLASPFECQLLLLQSHAPRPHGNLQCLGVSSRWLCSTPPEPCFSLPGGPAFPLRLCFYHLPLRPLPLPSLSPDGSTVLLGGLLPQASPGRGLWELQAASPRPCLLRLPLRAWHPKGIPVHARVSVFRVLSKQREKGRM